LFKRNNLIIVLFMNGVEEKSLKNLSEVKFEDLKEKSFEIILAVEMLCEVCAKPLRTREKFQRRIQFSNIEDYAKLLNRARIHDRAEVDVANNRIYFYDHDFPGDIHSECIEKLK